MKRSEVILILWMNPKGQKSSSAWIAKSRLLARKEPVDYTQVMLIVGIVLILLGIRFQSSTED